jgi:hypothetical protein
MNQFFERITMPKKIEASSLCDNVKSEEKKHQEAFRLPFTLHTSLFTAE